MWSPYKLGAPARVRSLRTPQGLGDRLRFIAFAERQAHYAFLEAAERFTDAPSGLADAWRWIAQEEAKHESWLLARLAEIGQDVAEVPQSLDLYQSFTQCRTAHEFALFIANAEERGRVGAEHFARALAAQDPRSSELFAQIGREEVEHVALVSRFFP